MLTNRDLKEMKNTSRMRDKKWKRNQRKPNHNILEEENEPTSLRSSGRKCL